MIAISSPTQAEMNGPVAEPRTGSLRRIDDILAELLVGYASVAKQPAAEDIDSAQPERLIGAPVSVPAEIGSCCVPVGEGA
jgi:hypothetical protein